MRKKRLCIDLNSIIPLFTRGYLTGIGKTTLELVRALANITDLPFDIVLFSENMKGIGSKNMDLPFEKKHLYFPHRANWDKILACFPVKEVFLRYDLMHIPHNHEYLYNPSKSVITLHDALFMIMQEEIFAHHQMKEEVPPLMRKCRAIMTCSEASKQDIVRYMNVPEDKISVVPWGISSDIFFPEKTEIIENFKVERSIDRPYFTMVSCSEGRKNTVTLLKSFYLYLKQGGNNNLILLWKNAPEKILDLYRNEIGEGRIRIIPSLEESQLRALYSGAEATFFPSRYEGFGLPVLESMACGTPVVTCRNSSLEEVGGDVAFYTDPDGVEEMADYMWNFERHKYNIPEIKEKGIIRASGYTWAGTAEKYVEFYMKNIGV